MLCLLVHLSWTLICFHSTRVPLVPLYELSRHSSVCMDTNHHSCSSSGL